MLHTKMMLTLTAPILSIWYHSSEEIKATLTHTYTQTLLFLPPGTVRWVARTHLSGLEGRWVGGGPDESPTSRVAVLAMDVDEDGGLGASLFAVFRLHLHLVLQGCHKGQTFCSRCQLTAKWNIPRIQLSVIIYYWSLLSSLCSQADTLRSRHM